MQRLIFFIRKALRTKFNIPNSWNNIDEHFVGFVVVGSDQDCSPMSDLKSTLKILLSNLKVSFQALQCSAGGFF